MATSQAVYNLFLRNWYNRAATEIELDKAIAKGLLTEEDKIAIMATSQKSITE